MASHYGVPVIALCGGIVKIAVSYTNMALPQCGRFVRGQFPLSKAMTNGERYLADTVEICCVPYSQIEYANKTLK